MVNEEWLEMTNKVKWVLIGCAIAVLGMSHHVCAQDDLLGALLQDLDGNDQKANNEAPKENIENAPVAQNEPVVQNEPVAQNAPVVLDEDAVLVGEVALLEKLRRESFDSHGMASLEKARALAKAGDNMGAIDQYKQALDFLLKRPANEAFRKEAETGLAEAYYREANLLLNRYDKENAKAMAEEALQLGHPRAARLLEKITTSPVKEPLNLDSISHRINEESYKMRQDDIRKRLRLSRQYFVTAEFERALEECEVILRDYPDNVEAIELRGNIARRLNAIAKEEELATRDIMIKDVTKTWTAEGRYAVNSAQTPSGKSVLGTRTPTGISRGTQTSSQIVNAKLRSIILPEVSFRPPATIIDAVDFFKQASRDYDNPEIPVDQRGVNLILKLPSSGADASGEPSDMFAPAPSAAPGIPVISAMTARNISLFDALKLVCEVTGMKTRVTGNIVMIVPLNDPDRELVRRSYNVLPSLPDKIGSAMQSMPARNTPSSGGNTFMTVSDMGGSSEEADWKKFFTEMGVQWPTGSSISYSLGKLRVTNTEDNLAVFEQVLEELNVTEKLVEIEARFVEVSQEDLNSLGFEWLLNGDYSFNAGGFAKNLLGLQNMPAGTFNNGLAPGTGNWNGNPNLPDPLNPGKFLNQYGRPTPQGYVPAPSHNVGVTGWNNGDYSTGQRYLNSAGNPVAGQNAAINDQFLRLNAFIGGADISMILHALSNRSDTDLLSAPKVTVLPDQEAVMKVVTEYIYPSEFNVQISQQGSGGGSGTGYSTGEPVAIVEPQNFTMREVGVILQVVPKLSEDGQLITLTMRPQVVSEPVWKNYGTRLPKTIQDGTDLLGNPIYRTDYIELPMEQPFFNVRSVETSLTINNGSTVVMGGLITEARTTIDDKVPFLGDIPYLGRLFRSHAEQTTKRNLLIFVTARTLDTSGRILRGGSGESLLVDSMGASGAAVPVGDGQ